MNFWKQLVNLFHLQPAKTLGEGGIISKPTMILGDFDNDPEFVIPINMLEVKTYTISRKYHDPEFNDDSYLGLSHIWARNLLDKYDAISIINARAIGASSLFIVGEQTEQLFDLTGKMGAVPK